MMIYIYEKDGKQKSCKWNIWCICMCACECVLIPMDKSLTIVISSVTVLQLFLGFHWFIISNHQHRRCTSECTQWIGYYWHNMDTSCFNFFEMCIFFFSFFFSILIFFLFSKRKTIHNRSIEFSPFLHSYCDCTLHIFASACGVLRNQHH